MKRINVLIISYKQQELIKRALESILCQKAYGLNHIVVCDDHSPDNTWQVLNEYQEMYPDILKIHQNPQNLGIYGNFNMMISKKGEADVYYIMAGDDALCEGIFEQVQKKIVKEEINCSESVAMYFDWKFVKPDGSETVYSNKSVLSSKDAFGLKLRNRYSCRSCFVTYGLMKNYQQVDTSFGISLAESLADLQYSRLAKYNYHESYVGSIYYSGIGVSTTLFNKVYYEESALACEHLIKIINPNKKDHQWLLYRMNYNLYMSNPRVIYFIKSLFYYIMGDSYISICNRLLNVGHMSVHMIKKLIS